MHIVIITSTKDPASMNIREHLLKEIPFAEQNGVYSYNNITLHTLNSDLIHAEYLDKTISADLFIFASKHVSAAKKPALTVHALGNFGPALYGGEERILCSAPTAYIKAALQKLEKYAAGIHSETHYEVIQEATHHGPYLDKPLQFIEIGSTEKEWQDKNAGKIVAQVIKELYTEKIKEYKSAVGIGGLHHCPAFKKIQLQEEIAIGHVCAKYNLEHLDEVMLQQALKRSMPKAEIVVLDWKGLGEHKHRIKEMLEKMNLKIVEKAKIYK